MRIPDEKQMYEPGDEAMYKDTTPVKIHRVETINVYYEHRPVASYVSYLYTTVDEQGTRRLVEAVDLSPADKP